MKKNILGRRAAIAALSILVAASVVAESPERDPSRSTVAVILERYETVKTLDQMKELEAELGRTYPAGIDARVADVFRGSLYAKMADESALPWDKLSRVKKGVALMKSGMESLAGDKSLSGVDLMTLHVTRGITSGYIPTSFQPRSVTIDELDRAIAMSEFALVDKKTEAEAYAVLSRAYRETGDAAKETTYRHKAENADPAMASAVFAKR
jgi:hypothetical protein